MPGHLRPSVRSSRCAPAHCSRWLVCAMLVVALCLVNVSLAQDQALELLTDTGDGEVPQATIPTETVQVARPGAIPELDNYDPGRYQRVAGQRSSLVYSFEETVSRVTLVLYFHEDTDEQVTLVEGDAVQTPVTSRGTQARISDAENDCEDSAVRNRGPIEVCRLRTTTWFRVTVSNPLASCSKEVTVRLEGSSSQVVALGDIIIYGPNSKCKAGTAGLSIGIIAAAVGGAVVLLVIIGICCWQCMKPKNDPRPYGGPYGAQDDHMNPMHPMNQAAGPEDGLLGRQTSQRNSPPHNSQHQHQHQYQGQSNSVHQPSSYASPAASDYAHNNSAWSSPAPAASHSVPQPAQPRQQQLAEKIPDPAYPTKHASPAVANNVPEAVKYSQSVTGTTATAQQPSENNLVSIPSTRQPVKQTPHVEQMTQSDDEEVDHAIGPVFDEQPEEQPDPTQNAMLKDIHLQQAAGITEMIQGVKDNLMQMQTLKNRDGQADASLEIFNKIGGGGFGEVFKGKYKGEDIAPVLNRQER